MQEMESLKRYIEPQQDAILSQDKLAATLEGDKKEQAATVLAGMRKVDKSMRDRLYVLQVQKII